MSGKQVRLFLVDGTPGGLTTAEITNWTGHVLAARRSDLADLLVRPECGRTGVYILLADDAEAIGGTRCYVGEADIVAERLRSHEKNKDFWDRVVVITSKDANLTKSHGRYLESRLLSLAARAGRATLENGTAPATPPLPEADVSDMDYFVSQLQIVLPVLGVNAFRAQSAVARPQETRATVSPVFALVHPKSGADARAQQIDGEFTMLAGSVVATSVRASTRYRDSTAKAYASYQALHDKLVADGSIVVDQGRGMATRDIVFSSPSTAGSIALGRSCNGRTSWVTAEGETFGAWESRGVDESADAPPRLAGFVSDLAPMLPLGDEDGTE